MASFFKSSALQKLHSNYKKDCLLWKFPLILKLETMIFKFLFIIIYFLSLHVYECLPVCMSVYPKHATPSAARRGQQYHWNWSYRLSCGCWKLNPDPLQKP